MRFRIWRKRKHIHDWHAVAVGATGWTIYECSTCGEREI